MPDTKWGKRAKHVCKLNTAVCLGLLFAGIVGFAIADMVADIMIVGLLFGGVFILLCLSFYVFRLIPDTKCGKIFQEVCLIFSMVCFGILLIGVYGGAIVEFVYLMCK